MTNHLNEEHIRVAAYYLWENAGRPEGMEIEFWNQACNQLSASHKNSKKVCSKNCAKSFSKANNKLESKKPSSMKLSAVKTPAVKPTVMAKAFYGIKK